METKAVKFDFISVFISVFCDVAFWNVMDTSLNLITQSVQTPHLNHYTTWKEEKKKEQQASRNVVAE